MKLTEDEVIQILRYHRKDAFGATDKQLSNDRAEAMDRYHGRPYGDEEEGYSSFVTRDLAENVDWAMPSIMRPFIQSGVLAEFKPNNKNDEDQVRIESDYVNYVIMEENDGFLLLHDAIKDSLILKNGYCKHYWEESEEVFERSWKNVSELEVLSIIDETENDKTEFEITETEENDDGTINLTALIKTKVSGVKILAVPPEELKISNKCRGSLKDADYVGHTPVVTRSDLIEMGIDKNWLDKISPHDNDGYGYENERASQEESDARDSTSDESDETHLNADKSMQEMDYAEEYVRMDYDDDGIAELRRIITVSDQFPPGEEWNKIVDTIPFTGGTPKRMPHRHIGESFQDDLADLAEQHTTLVRQMFDNVYRTNNNQWAINERVDEEEFLDQGPAATFRVSGKEPVNGSIEAIRHESIAQHLLPVISYIEEKKKKRTGVNDNDLNPDVIKQATKAAFLEDLNRKSQKIEMTTRMLGETLVKELVSAVHALIVKHQDEPVNIKLSGQYVDVDASSWKPRKRVTVKIGLGTGNTEERIRKLTMLKSLQAEMMQLGLVSPEEAYLLYVDIAKELGEVNPEKYVVTPDQNNPKYQKLLQQRKQGNKQPNPLAEAEQVKGQFKLQAEQMSNNFKMQLKQAEEASKNALALQKEQSTNQIALLKLQMENSNAEKDRKSKELIEAAKLEISAMIEGIRIDIGQPGIGVGLGGPREYDYDPFTQELTER